jgi:hypothetical protein
VECRLILVALQPAEEDYLDYLLGDENEQIQDPDE